MSVYISKAQQDTQNFKVVIILDVLVGHFTASLALFEAVVIILELPDNFGEGPTLNTYKTWLLLFFLLGDVFL